MMNNCSELLQQAESLKQELNNGRNGLSSDGTGKGEWVSSRSLLQDVYRQLLITNLEYALDKKIEQELWNFAFKNHITALQQQVKDKSNTFRSEAQSQLTSFLDAASGFYTQLLDDLCQTFHVDIPFRVHSSKLVFLKDASSVKHRSIAQPERPSCQYMCQHSLVHLGDIARYRNQIGQAESYYRYAAQLVPSNGQPYNQLAILAAAGGDVLGTAFYYCRSLAVKCPFPGSNTNLRRQLSKIMAGDEPRHTKISTSELVKFCLKFHACIYLKKHENELHGMVERLSGHIRAHLRTGSLSKQQITHITFLNLFSLYHLAPNGVDETGGPIATSTASEDNCELAKDNHEKNEQENTSWNALLTFTMHMLSGLLACVPAHSDDASDLEHPSLPSIKLTLDWLTSSVSALLRPEVTQNSRVWPRLAKVLNALGNQDKANNMDNHHLPEDLEVRGFIGLKASLSKLDFLGGIDSGVPGDMEHACRCYRLFQLGLAISRANGDLLSSVEENNGTVFSSSISPSPQHGARINGVDERSEEDDDEEEEEELGSSPPKSGAQRVKEGQFLDSQTNEGSSRRAATRTKGVLKVLTDDHSSSSMRKKNRAPRMQNVAVQIKPDQKLKVIKEEEGGHSERYLPLGEGESGGASTESSQGELSPCAVTHARSGHRVTFATAQQVSPTPYPQDDSPSPMGTSYMDHPNVVMPGMMYPDSPHPGRQQPQQQQQSYNMHLMSQQMGPIYRQPPAGSPILTGPFARRSSGVGAYPFPHNMITRPHAQLSPYQHLHPSNPPPHPAELPKPVFRGSMYPTRSTDNYRAPSLNAPVRLTSQNQDPTMEQVLKMSRSNDMGYFQHLHPNPVHNLSNLPPTSHDMGSTQRPGVPGLTMAAQFVNRPSNLNAAMLQQLRLKEMASDPSSESHLTMSTASNASYHPQNVQKINFPNQNLDFSQFANASQQQQQMMMHSQGGSLPNPTNTLPPQSLQSVESDLSRLPSELTRGYFPGNLMSSSTNAAAVGGNSHTTSAPSAMNATLNQLNNLPNTTGSPQSGSLNNSNYSGNVLRSGLSSMLMDHPRSGEIEAPRRPNTLPGPQIQHGNIGFVGSPTQKLTPTGLGQFLNVDHPQSEQGFARDMASHPTPSIFGVSQASTSGLVDDRRKLGHPPPNQPSSADSYSIQQDRVKAIFEESNNMNALPQIPKNSLETLQANQASAPPIDKFQDPAAGKEDKDSYKLFPVTDTTWGISRGNRGEGLGLSGLGTIGSERAAAQTHRYSPWGGPQLQSPSTTGGPHSEKIEPQRGSEINEDQTDPNFSSFWSTSMVPSGPSALEQLIRQQQQHHVTRDKSPP